MRRRALGIEWRDRVLTVVAAERAGEDVEVVRASERAWGEDAPLAPEAVRAFCEGEDLPRGTATLVVSGSAAASKPLVLPPVDLEEQRKIVRENGDRYFLFPAADRSYDIFATDDDGGAAGHVRWAVAAAADDIRALLDGFAAAGIVVRAVTAAESVYPAAVRWLDGPEAEDPGRVIRIAGDHVDRVDYRDGRVAEIDSSETAEAGGPGLRAGAVLLADPAAAPGDGPRVAARPPVDRPGTFAGALGAAMAHLDGATGPDLIPPAVRASRDRRNRLRTFGLTAAAALLSLLALYLAAGERARQRADLQARLERTRAEAEAVLEMRADLDRAHRQLSLFGRLQAAQNDYAPVLIQMSEALPTDAWIVSFVSSDPREAVVTGYARSATDALTALTRAPLIEDVRFERPTRSTELGGEAFEAFTMALTFSPEPAGPERGGS